jgi:hypothetical protein
MAHNYRDSVADWIIQHLKVVGHEKDNNLHWLACNVFMTRDQILTGGRYLETFSEQFDDAILYLREEYYISFRDDEIWSTAERSKPDRIKVKFHKEQTGIKISCFYIIQFESGVKVGMTSNFKTRVRSYCSPWCQPIEAVYIVRSDEQGAVEDHVKRCFGKHKIGRSREYLDISHLKIKKEIESSFPALEMEHYLHKI